MVQVLTSLAMGLAPVVFLIGLLDMRLARTDIGGLLVELDRDPTLDLQAPLARALHDPSLELAYWLPDQDSWADQDGLPIALPERDQRRSIRLIYRNGEPIAALFFDPALDDEEELLDAVLAAAGIALENGRLRAELRAKLQELQSSRVRALEAGRRERQRLERNLHDGAQQRLVGISIELGSLENRLTADPQLRQRLARTREEVSASLDQLRDIARGIYPAVLSGHGLAVALESLTAGAAVPVSLRVELTERLPEPVEVAAYYIVSEALANIGKHAHADTATVRVDREADRLVVEVVDDGIGGASIYGGSGLRGLRDRAEVLGGEVLHHQPGRWRQHHSSGDPMRIAIAEDSMLVREGLTRILREADLDVVAAYDNADALLREVRRTPPDLVIVDIRLPPTHADEGIRAAIHIREHHPQVAVLVLSQYVELGLAMQLLAQSAEGIGYLLKDRIGNVNEFISAVQRVAEWRLRHRSEDRQRPDAAAPQRQSADPPDPAGARGTGADGDRHVQPGDRRPAGDHDASHREVRLQHLRQARHPVHRNDSRRVMAVLLYLRS